LFSEYIKDRIKAVTTIYLVGEWVVAKVIFSRVWGTTLTKATLKGASKLEWEVALEDYLEVEEMRLGERFVRGCGRGWYCRRKSQR
jgi:hypothetical protein